MRKLMTLTLIGALAAASQPAAAKGALKDLPIDKNFIDREVTWTNARGGMDIMWSMMRMDGKLWVCGAVRFKPGRSYIHDRKVLRKGWVRRGSLKGKKVMSNLSFFKTIKSHKSFDGAMATCRDTGLKPDNALYYMSFDPHMASF